MISKLPAFTFFVYKFLDYGDFHRALLQTVMAHGTIEKEAFIEVFKKLAQKYNLQELEPKNIDEVIDMVNAKISPFDQKITRYVYALTNDEFFIFHSTAATSMSKFQNAYNEDELDYFKHLIRNIAANEDLTITPLSALNLSAELPAKINKVRAEKLLDTWMQSHYFFKHDNEIHMGAKLLTEFKELLQSMELDYLKSCLLCESIAIWVRSKKN